MIQNVNPVAGGLRPVNGDAWLLSGRVGKSLRGSLS